MDLAPYAVTSEKSRGRQHSEPPSAGPSRSPFAVDRQRVVQSTAFRRLEYKTQVFVVREHDHFRTRLTHTLEVAELARRLAAALGANEVLAETISLAHDLGHPPFGHAGETALNEIMAEHGGFEHNAQSLRIVDYLEHPFPEYRGLNLSFEVREGLAKHETAYDRPSHGGSVDASTDDVLAADRQPTLEGQVASLADRLAYCCHDLEDALAAGLVGEADLAGQELWTMSADPVRSRYPHAKLPAVRRPVLNAMGDHLVNQAVWFTLERIKDAGVESVEDVRAADAALVGLPTQTERVLQRWEQFLLTRVYRHKRVAEKDEAGKRTVRGLFDAYLADPSALPPRFAARISHSSAHRVVCDYVAGMTDRYCRRENERLLGPGADPS